MRKNYISKFYKLSSFFIKFTLIFTGSLSMSAQLYSNGPISTGSAAANGTVAPIGYTWSETQADSGNTTEANASFGYGGFYNTALTSDVRMADDFIVPAGQTWNVTNFAFFCYQTSYAGTVPPIDALRIQIYNGDPAAGGTLVAGNMTSSVYDAANSGEAFVYRIANTVVPSAIATGTARKVWRVRGNITASLTAGTYWVVYQGHATNDASFFVVPVTLANARGRALANAKQLTVSSSAWANIFDSGIPTTAPDVAQEMSFFINDVTLSTTQFENKTGFVLYPNPVQSSVTISTPNDGSIIKNIEILDALGRIIKKITPTENNLTIDCADLSAGNYIVKMNTENGIYVQKMIKN